MKSLTIGTLVMISLVGLPALAQQSGQGQTAASHRQAPQQERPRANQGHIPSAPTERADKAAMPQAERQDGNRSNNTPHVNNDVWYGHDRPNDPRYVLTSPFVYGPFERVGP
jgi:hypothetical protein